MTPIPVPPSCVLFDLDGVLIDSFGVWVAVIDACLARRGRPPVGEAGVRPTWGQGVGADVATFFPETSVKDLAAEYDAEFLRHLDRIAPIPGAPATVARLSAAGIPLALVTNSPVVIARAALERAGLAPRFAVIAAGDEVAHPKPAPDLLRLALARLGDGAAGRPVMVGDTTLDLAAAAAARIPCVGYRISGDARVERMDDIPTLLGLGRGD